MRAAAERVPRAAAVAALLALAAVPANAQTGPGLLDDCDPQRVEALSAQRIGAAWAELHPGAMLQRMQPLMAAGRFAEVADTVRARFLETAAARTPEGTARFLPRLDSLREALRGDHDLVRIGIPDFTVDPDPNGAFVEVFPGPAPIVLTPETPSDVRRGFCWTAIVASRIISVHARPRLDSLIARLDATIQRWDNYASAGYSQYPWELFVNGLTGRPRGIEPPSGQVVLLHPTVGIEVAGARFRDLRRLDVIPLEVIGYLQYNEQRTRYYGASLVTTFSSDAAPAVGPFLHLGGGMAVGPTWRISGSRGGDGGFGGVLFSADLYRLVAGVPGEVRQRMADLEQARERIAAARSGT